MILQIFEKKVALKYVIYVVLLGVIILGLLYVILKLLNNLPTDKDLINSIIGICSTIVSSILSAIVAYLVSNRQVRLEQEKNILRNNRYEKLLLYELKENKKVLERKDELLPDKKKYLTAINKLINFDSWNSLKDKMEFTDDMIEPVFKAYHSLITLKAEQKEEAINLEDFPETVRRTQQRVEIAVESITNKKK